MASTAAPPSEHSDNDGASNGQGLPEFVVDQLREGLSPERFADVMHPEPESPGFQQAKARVASINRRATENMLRRSRTGVILELRRTRGITRAGQTRHRRDPGRSPARQSGSRRVTSSSAGGGSSGDPPLEDPDPEPSRLLLTEART